jgi:hypothetical protein
MFDLTGTRLIYKTYKTYSSISQWRAVCRYMHYTTSTIKEGWPQLKDNNLGVFFTAQIHLESKVKCNLYLKSEDIYTNKQANMSSVEFLNWLILIKNKKNK